MASGVISPSGAPYTADSLYFYHATYCGWFYDGTNQWYYVYPAEGGIVYVLNNLYASLGLQTTCGEGHYAAVYCTNSSCSFDQTISYPSEVSIYKP